MRLVAVALLVLLPGLAAPDVYQYDAAGRVSRIIAPDGRVTRYDYDALGVTVQRPPIGAGSAAAGRPARRSAITPAR
nr:RHS repeat domain-containing protein [Thiorhodococcus minor]